jgi:DNA-binding transcriptional ArsR family regulator
MNNTRTNKDTEARKLSGGEWYWIHRSVIRNQTRQIGAIGLTVYNVLASMADSHQECFPSQRHIAELIGYSRSTVNKALKTLERQGLIAIIKRSPYHCRYCLIEPRCKAGETGMSNGGNRDVNLVDTNNNQITRITNKIVGVKKEDISFPKPVGSFIPETREELLALDLATDLGDFESLPRYLSLAHRYPESLLRRLLSETRQVPVKGIRKSRAALFIHLLHKYAQKTD